MRWVILGIFGLALSGCAVIPDWAGGGLFARNTDAPEAASAPVALPDAETGDDVALTDDAVAPDVAPAPGVAPTPEVPAGALGRTVASLGNAAEPGLWLKTPLVAAEQPGRVFFPDTDTTVEVTLIPIDGPATAGSRLSLSAMQALGAPLTGLPEVDVFGG